MIDAAVVAAAWWAKNARPNNRDLGPVAEKAAVAGRRDSRRRPNVVPGPERVIRLVAQLCGPPHFCPPLPRLEDVQEVRGA